MAALEQASMPQIRSWVAKDLAMTDSEMSALLPSGRQPRFHNRVNWALIYLRAAGLTRRVRRGVYAITPQGREVVSGHPHDIDVEFLKQFPSFVSWLEGNGEHEESPTSATTSAVSDTDSETPEEQIDAGYRTYRQAVEAELINQILDSSPKFFEELVVELLVAMGYGGSRDDAGRALGGSGDGGVDGIIKEDRLGLDAVFIQAKRWDPGRSVSRPDVQAFAGSLEGERARKGVFITTSSFTREAHDYVKRIEKKIVLIDGKLLASLMFDYGVGVRTKQVYEIKELDDDYFTEA